MAAPKGFAWSFRDVSILNHAKVCFVAGHDESASKNIPVTFYFRWAGTWSSKPFPINGTAICTCSSPEPHALMMGVDGRIIRVSSKGFSEENVDPSKDGPQHLGDLREIRTIGSHAYVSGMRRIVYRCESPSVWRRIDQGVRTAPDDKSDAGLNSIHGFSESDIYGVGWNGEIWHYNGKKWKQVDSPTNLALFRIVCAPDQKSYACGQRGVILSGDEDRWKEIRHEATKEDFWGATWFKGSLYLSTSNGIFRLVGDEVLAVEIKSKEKLTFIKNASFFRLDANAEVLWSVGEKMALYTEDGVNWTETPYK